MKHIYVLFDTEIGERTISTPATYAVRSNTNIDKFVDGKASGLYGEPDENDGDNDWSLSYQ
jgi:hypothetical protein